MPSRRTFLRGVAALPIVAGPLFAVSAAPRIAVIGAGAFGGWTALQLRRMGARVTLIDAWGAGNVRSSSGGETRVIRAIYGPDRVYVEMVQRAYALWEALDDTLYVETGVLWMHRGDDAYVRSSLPLLAEFGFPVDALPLADARRRYPHINFDGTQSIYLERRAGVLRARRACAVVRDAFTRAGGIYRTAHARPGAIANGSMASLDLEDGSHIEADAFVFACGPWFGKVFPEVLGDTIRSSRQEVFYFGTPRGTDRYMSGRFPVWIDFGERIFYGLPDIGGEGFKIADDTRGDRFDPTHGDRTPSAHGINRARRLLAERFPELAKAPLLKAEVCQYENSPDGHLVIDRHPAAKNVFLVGGGSGHGFKLAPAIGEMTAQWILAAKEPPKTFRLERLRDAKKSTQFDHKE